MRIAIAGASGTGKTYLAKAISDEYGWPFNPVGARSVALSMGFDNPYDVDRAGKRNEFQEELFTQKLEWEYRHDNFVTDRSYLDNLSYCALHMASALLPGAIEEYQHSMARYEVVFVLGRGVFQKLDDGIRVTSETYHQIYEILLTKFLESAPCRVIAVTCPLEGRRAFVEDEIDSWLTRRDWIGRER